MGFTLGNIAFSPPRVVISLFRAGVLRTVSLAAPDTPLLSASAEAEFVACAHLPSRFSCWLLKVFVFI